MPATSDHPYFGRPVALLTQHGKEQVIAPVLAATPGCRVERIDGYDTDQLGTFSREIPRFGTQLEAARRKARLGMELSGLPLGVASEGAFGPDPVTALCAWNVEILLWLDDALDIEIVARAQGQATFAHVTATGWASVESFAHRMQFPGHHMVVRPGCADDPRIRKGIDTWVQLEAAFRHASAQSADGTVFIETDVRAHANPTRMSLIRVATEDLSRRLASRCPACATPGFAIIDYVRGLPCMDCALPTSEPVAERLGCVACDHRLERRCTGPASADPGRCDACNP